MTTKTTTTRKARTPKNPPASPAATAASATIEPTSAADIASAAPASSTTPTPTPTKQSQLIALLLRDEGATLAAMVAATGWLPHTTRAAMTGLKKKGYTIDSDKLDGVRTYRATAPETAVPDADAASTQPSALAAA